MVVYFLPDANMPLFTMISGFVYCYLQKYEGKYNCKRELIKGKIKRLLFPYFIIGTIVVFTISDWNPQSIIYGDAHHLWFCAMLFWCFLEIEFFEILPLWIKPVLILICIASGFVYYGYDILYAYRSLHYFPYFLMGYYLVDLLPLIQAKLAIRVVIVLFAVLMIGITFLNIKYISSLSFLTYTFIFPLSLFSIVPINIKPQKMVSLISTYSFGIYVFHEWFLWNIAHIKYVQSLIIEHQIIYPIIMFVAIFFISTVLTHYSLKTKIGKYLLS